MYVLLSLSLCLVLYVAMEFFFALLSPVLDGFEWLLGSHDTVLAVIKSRRHQLSPTRNYWERRELNLWQLGPEARVLDVVQCRPPTPKFFLYPGQTTSFLMNSSMVELQILEGPVFECIITNHDLGAITLWPQKFCEHSATISASAKGLIANYLISHVGKLDPRFQDAHWCCI